MIKAICIDFGGVLFPTQPFKTLPTDEGMRQLKSAVINIYNKRENEIKSSTYSKKMFLKDLKKDDFDNNVNAKRIYKSIIKPNKVLLKFIRKSSKTHTIYGLVNEAPKWTELRQYFCNLSSFKKVYVSSYIGQKKPHKDAFLHFLNDAGLKPSECVFLDDNAHNVSSANTLGLKAFLYTNANKAKRDLSKVL